MGQRLALQLPHSCLRRLVNARLFSEPMLEVDPGDRLTGAKIDEVGAAAVAVEQRARAG